MKFNIHRHKKPKCISHVKMTTLHSQMTISHNSVFWFDKKIYIKNVNDDELKKF